MVSSTRRALLATALAAALVAGLTGAPAGAAPARPAPLDLYFLVQTSVSMDSAVPALPRLLRDVSREIGRSRADVWIGAGEFRDYTGFMPRPSRPQVSTNWVYRRITPVTADRAAVAAGFENMQPRGAGDEPEAQTIALVESVTGTGRLAWVDPGQHAGFRAGARRLIVLVTNAPFHEGGTPPLDYPTIAEAAQALSSRDVGVVGLVAPGGAAHTGLLHVGMLAARVGPRVGRHIDCDGDAFIDVRAGSPLVCPFDRRAESFAGFAAAIVGFARR